jgi:hypothetical protein
MPQDVADTGNILPANFLMLRFQLAPKMTAGFRDNLYSALDRGTQQPGALVITKRFSGKRLLDPADAFKHIVDTQQRTSRDHSENPRRLSFDLSSNQGMEALASGEIDLDSKALLKQSLGRDQIQCIEASAWIVVQEKVDIAFGTGLVAGG